MISFNIPSILQRVYLIILFLLANPIQGGCEVPPSHFVSQVLRQDTTWSGTIFIKGVVVVGRQAELTIKPGTRILFRYLDTNNDNIGDSEIRVLGKISAIGTREAPIIFSSAEKNPMPRDWSYLLIFTSGAHNTIRFCTFRDAFSGLQVHFSSAVIDHNRFTKNQEGLRFGRAKLTVTNNTFTNNQIGIRFTRMEGPVNIRRNIISANDTGIFLVPSGQNIVDFFEPGRTGKPWNKGHLAIFDNNIYQNHDYNLKLGAKQMWDLDISNNWWGSSKIEIIRSKIYDNHQDNDLGTAIVRPFNQSLLKQSGAASNTDK